jgi:hypothetical protein
MSNSEIVSAQHAVIGNVAKIAGNTALTTAVTDGKWLPIRAWSVDRLVHLFVRGDVRPGAFAQGRTLRDAPGTLDLRMRGQFVEKDGDITVIRTELADARGIVIQHRLTRLAGRLLCRHRRTNASSFFTRSTPHPIRSARSNFPQLSGKSGNAWRRLRSRWFFPKRD